MSENRVVYSFDEDRGDFTIENYNWAKPFSNFLPGVAGKWGIPMWTYYVSRNQCISSFGIQDKDHAIMEFLSFNKACQAVGKLGFRTFIKTEQTGIYEAFQKTENPVITQKMVISSHELELEEINLDLGLKINVLYFNLVNLPLPGLIRQVMIENISDQPISLECLDGAPRILPYGVTFEHMKVIARHIEGMMGVDEYKGAPIFRLKQTAADMEEIGAIGGGNFYCSKTNTGKRQNENIIVDPKVIFDEIEDPAKPWSFAYHTVEEILKRPQIRENRTPCAMTLVDIDIKLNEKLQLDSVIGYVDSLDKLDGFLTSMSNHEFLGEKRKENRETIEQVKQVAFTVSGEPAFDQYCQQNYLDNVLRGGMPLNLGTRENPSTFYSFHRQGGDLERDYHWIILESTYLSQGNGHYRNTLQNRRMDTWLFPGIGEHNIHTFMNLIQLDGYNPLEVRGESYIASDEEKIKSLLVEITQDKSCIDSLLTLTKRPFTPGEFVIALEDCVKEIKHPYEEILARLLPLCHKREVGALHEGFWIDHWFYNLDLIESYLALYPDRIQELLIDNYNYTYYDNPDIVQPRMKKTILIKDKVRQYMAVVRDPDKEALIASRSQNPSKVHTNNGQGEVYLTNLLGKLLCLLTNKIASLDPQGIGVEMEAGKPGWCDSLNGLPGLFGSSICETLELIRLCRFLISSINNLSSPLGSQLIFVELKVFMNGIRESIQRNQQSNEANKAMIFWEDSHTLKEEYRGKTKFGINGSEKEIALSDIHDFVQECLDFLEGIITDHLNEGIMQNGVPTTYFVSQVTGYDVVSRKPTKGQPQFVKANDFEQKAVAPFLEGPTHYIRMYPERGKEVFDAVRRSDIFDEKLQTFKVCGSLEDESYELGRIKAYPSGWIENESLYTHMQYKWLLEMLRAGLYEEFFKEIKTAFPPFLDPNFYGRSILENCSFIASSANPDESIHGQGFQPRFSGVTAEMINMWLLMVVGKAPFSLDENNALQFQLNPILPAWLFTKDESHHRLWQMDGGWEDITIPPNSFAFKLMGNTLVVYSNPDNKPTYGEDSVKVRSYTLTNLNGKRIDIQRTSIREPIAHDIRNQFVSRMEVLLG
jgi:hypothetical protein